MDPTDFMLDEWFLRERLQSLYTQNIWMTNEGKQIKLKDLTTQHLKNIIAMIKRNSPGYVNGVETDAWLFKLEEELTKRLI